MPPIDIEEFDRLVTSAERPGLGVYSRIMERLVAVTGAKAGAFWNCDDKPFTAIVHYSAGEAAKIGFSQSDHDRILAQVVQQQRSAVVKSKAIDSSEAPTLFFAPVKGHTRRVVELVFPGNHRIRSSREFLQELHRICEVFEKLQPLANAAMDSARPVAQEHISVEAFSRYVHALHSSMDGRLTAANIANESRQLLDCDRVSVVHWHRGRFRILAISGQLAVNRRSNTVQLLERLAAEVLKAKTELWYPTDEELVPQIKSVLDAYLVQATTRSLVIQPIAALALAQHEDTEESQRTSNVVIGGVIYEHNRELWSRAEQATTLNLTTQQSGNAFRNAKQHQELFLYPLWRWLGKSRLLTSPARLPTTLLVFAALVALSLFLAFWPVPFYISASGILVPQDRRFVFPKTPGEVISVNVQHGQVVKNNDTLAVMRSDDLQLRLEDVTGRMETLKQRRSAIERNKFKSVGNPTTAAGSIDENLGSLQAEIDSLERQAQGLSVMLDQLRVLSPMDGQIITWDVAQKLLGRTVTPQNVLMEIADTSGAWQLELDLEDRRIEHLLRGLAASRNGKLPVKFTLAADPNRVHEGTLTEVAQTIQLNHDSQQMMRVKVDIDEDTIQLKQARTGVAAKIYTGETTSIGYLWLNEIPRALNRYVVFYFVR